MEAEKRRRTGKAKKDGEVEETVWRQGRERMISRMWRSRWEVGERWVEDEVGGREVLWVHKCFPWVPLLSPPPHPLPPPHPPFAFLTSESSDFINLA